ncbi:hypothetical protein TYRP_008162 [Tyrophagus putrescentiae]|nr:hypothetical protein TYRP_008162 [Tyrophagus putrescentiae]
MKKKRKEKQMAVEERPRIEPLSNKPNQSSAVNNENPWNERLGTQKVATWLLGSTDTNWAPMPVQVRPQQMQQQQMQQQVPPNYFTSHPNRSSRPAVVGRPPEPTLQSPIVATNQQSPPIYMNQEFAAKMQPPLPPPQLSSLVMGRNVGPQSGRPRLANQACPHECCPRMYLPTYYRPLHHKLPSSRSGLLVKVEHRLWTILSGSRQRRRQGGLGLITPVNSSSIISSASTT